MSRIGKKIINIPAKTKVEIKENVITANGPSSALLFALAIVSASLGDAAAREVAAGMLLYPGKTPYYF